MTDNNKQEEVIVSPEEQKQLDKNGWFMHYVPVEKSIVNIHTHGMAENLHHVDLQMVLPIEEEMAYMLFSSVIDNIKNGYTYYEGLYNNVIEEVNIEFKKFTENGREVLRLILPDNNGVFPDDEQCESPYHQQLVEFE